jgi:hypothetical protein
MARGSTERSCVPENGQPKDERVWIVECHPELGEVDPDELAAAMVEAGGMVRRLGGALRITGQRRQVAEGLYVTERVIFQWTLHLPLVRRRSVAQPPQETEAEPMVEDAPEPVAAE